MARTQNVIKQTRQSPNDAPHIFNHPISSLFSPYHYIPSMAVPQNVADRSRASSSELSELSSEENKASKTPKTVGKKRARSAEDKTAGPTKPKAKKVKANGESAGETKNPKGESRVISKTMPRYHDSDLSMFRKLVHQNQQVTPRSQQRRSSRRRRELFKQRKTLWLLRL